MPADRADLPGRIAFESHRLAFGPLVGHHAEAVTAQEEEVRQRPKRQKVHHANKNLVPGKDQFKCPRCFFLNLYADRACNKLTCGACDTAFCIACGKPASASCRCISAAWART